MTLCVLFSPLGVLAIQKTVVYLEVKVACGEQQVLKDID
jgi:hypothetical protein